jgi:hypothetical protein
MEESINLMNSISFAKKMEQVYYYLYPPSKMEFLKGKNKALVGVILIMLEHSRLTKSYWAMAFFITNYL